MKKIVFFFLMTILIASCHQEELSSVPDEPEGKQPVFDLSEEEVLQGCIYVKLKEEPAGEVRVRSIGNTVTTGVKVLDRAASSLKIERMERTFPYAGKFEERTRKEGLHLWYNVWFSKETSATRAATEVAFLDGIETAVPVPKIVSRATPETAWSLYGVRTGEWLFNDPDLSRQWYLDNPGTESWQKKGADIRLFDVWKQYNGNPAVIVAVVDGGINQEHPDLQDNLWTNPDEIPGNGMDDDGNGYVDDIHGYNFVDDNATLVPHRHGTHVAGTIGATNNNGTGISSIAGGDGTSGSGVRLMSCQILKSLTSIGGEVASDPFIAAAIKYGADNGAVISQNSWGYAATRAGRNASSYINPVHKEAIDYFIKYAGCDNKGEQLDGSPMKGGIVLFASGNANTSDPRIAAPADYEKVVAVAAIEADYRKASYSNYGTYTDISAPGGSLDGDGRIWSTTTERSNNYEYLAGTSMACPLVSGVAALVIEKYGVGKKGFTPEALKEILYQSAYDLDGDGRIWSTTTERSNNYEYLAGTSMACPLVSGVAALVIEKYGVGKKGFTPEALKEILYQSAYDLDEYNPRYAGQLGHGCVDAAAALEIDVSNLHPFILKSNQITDNMLIFSVSSSMSGNGKLILYNGIGSKVLDLHLELEAASLHAVDITKLSAGYYTLVYQAKGMEIREKFIKY